MVIDMVSKCAPNIILCGHVKDVSLNEGLDGSVKDLDLTGKVKRILSARSDAIGFVIAILMVTFVLILVGMVRSLLVQDVNT